MRKASYSRSSLLLFGPMLQLMDSKKTVIAIVDDDEPIRRALASLVRSLGYEALTFDGGQELLDSPRRAEIRCLISDVQMPGMTGLELHARLVASGQPIPTILITAYPNDEARERALNSGVVCYLRKPFAEDELLACIRTTLNQPSA